MTPMTHTGVLLVRKNGVLQMRRFTPPMNGERYLGNKRSYEVHDLDQEDTSPAGCQIDEIIRAGNARPFQTLSAAHAAGFDNCAKCLGGSRR